ncbi:hypothetical protein BEH_24550 (plasmid) [Priestia filamentosa]|uniref:SprT-like domain-containing protein n=1 Tax=Priestia filamentosa TaxID=1402861 RepID=A0A2L1FFK5_9BACI|nr:hypothetical protein [Priestia filamentosa]AVD54537.1 hypothetical protein CKF96_03235 [Priestia filamentosa]AWG44873.1 hypothetical protein BEH_24550 [Priestia filamentosa]
MSSYNIYQTLCDVVKKAYPVEQYPNNAFTKFFVDIKVKEMKTIHGRYYPKTKKIEIFNLSRPNGHIIATSLHETAHHIDHCLRQKSDHTKAFYDVFYQLLVTAMGMGLVTKEDILTEDDSADKDRLEKHFGPIEEWDISIQDYKKNRHVVKVYQSFSIKDKLKNQGYKYSSLEQAWTREINEDEVEEEKNTVAQWIDEKCIVVEQANTMKIESYYYLCVSNCYDHRDYLRENGFRWNGYGVKKAWVKKIPTQSLEKEEARLLHLTNIKVKVATKK